MSDSKNNNLDYKAKFEDILIKRIEIAYILIIKTQQKIIAYI